jgi:hypothetical protein
MDPELMALMALVSIRLNDLTNLVANLSEAAHFSLSNTTVLAEAHCRSYGSRLRVSQYSVNVIYEVSTRLHFSQKARERA